MSEQPCRERASSRKRKCGGTKRPSPEEQLQEEQQERYNKLVYACRKALHKESKIVKSFECQKIVRKLKQERSESNDNTKLESRLTRAKAFSIETLVQVCLQRLGIPNMNPSKENPPQSHVVVDSLPQHDRDLLERMLQHKRMLSSVEMWNDKVAEYRQWLLRRHDSVAEGPRSHKTRRSLDRKSKQKGKESSKGIFVHLGGDPGDEMETETVDGKRSYSYYYNDNGGGEMQYPGPPVHKKNRPGQRSRRAKALAIQARKEGQVVDANLSLNWRAKKPKPDDSQNEQAPANKTAAPSEIATMGKTWKEDGKEHPSWAARQVQKSSIVAFAGKKTTFD